MTTILPAERTPFDVIGKDVGQALQSVLPQAMQKYGERQRGLNAIDQLQYDIANAGGDISKILPAAAKAIAQNPNLERSGIFEKLLAQAQLKQGARDFPVGQQMGQPPKTNASGFPLKPANAPLKNQPPQQQAPTPQQQAPINQNVAEQKNQPPAAVTETEKKQVPVSVNDLVQARPSKILNPQGLADFQLPYGPEEIARIRQASRENGYLPEMEQRFVEDALEFNRIAEQKRNVEVSNYDQQQKERQDTLDNQKQFGSYLQNNAKELWENPDDRELALQASEKILNNPNNQRTSFADVLSKVKDEIRPYQSAKKALQKTLERPLFGQTSAQRELARMRARLMVQNGQKPQLQLMIANAGHGEVEEADLLNPLPEMVENSLKNGFPKFVEPLAEVKDAFPGSEAYERQLQSGREKREAQEKKYISYVSEQFKTGDYSLPGTNLLLLRKNLMEKGLQWDEAANVIEKIIKESGQQMDPQQQIDFQKLGYPPLTGDNYLDTILNNIMYKVTGKE